MILALVNALDGINYHRILSPYAELKEQHDIHFFMNADDKEKGYQSVLHFETSEFSKFSHVLFNRIISPHGWNKEVIAKIRANGCKIVMDIDDNWQLPKGHYLYEQYTKAEIDKEIVTCIKAADVIQVASVELGKLIEKEFNKQTVLINNTINPLSGQFETGTNKHNYNHVAFVGGIGHRKDIESILPAIKAVQDSEYFDFTISGYAAGHREWELLRESVFRHGIECYFEPGLPVMEYANLYKNKGIILAPLNRNKFNDYKSPLKLIEAGHFSKAVICSDVPAFNGVVKDYENCIVAESLYWWEDALEKLLTDKDCQDSIRHQLHKDISKKFDFNKENEKRKSNIC